jgi:hypothetical protein
MERWGSRPQLPGLIAVRADNDVEMDGGPFKDGDINSRGQPALPPEKINLCQS